MKKLIYFIVLIVPFINLNAATTFSINLEAGGVWQHRNDVQIDPDTGTRVDFDNFNHGPLAHYRVEAFYILAPKHSIRALYAPFSAEITGDIKETVNFNDTLFDQDVDLTVNYKFNSYRLSYIYNLVNSTNHQFNIGITGKIRDALIKFSQPNIESSFDNVGFVPLFYLSYRYNFTPSVYFNLDTDFAFAPQGRAADLALKLRKELSANNTVGVGVRSIEGGAANDTVYTFSWFNYAVVEWIVSI